MNKKVIKGTKQEGNKNILILSGVHGNELTPIYCGMLLSEYSFHELKNNFRKITIINAVNMEGIKQNVRDIPDVSTTDLNRMFSSNKDDDISETIAKYIDENDIIIDLHASPNCKEMMLLNQNEYTNSYVEFAKKYEIPYLIWYSATNTIKKYSIELGKIGITIELNRMGRIDYDSSMEGFKIVLKIIENYKDFNIKEEEPNYEESIDFFTYREGLFITDKKVGDYVTNGDKLGYVLDLKTFEKYPIIYNKKDARIICFDDIQFVSASRPICSLQF